MSECPDCEGSGIKDEGEFGSSVGPEPRLYDAPSRSPCETCNGSGRNSDDMEMALPINCWRCGHCGYEGPCYGAAMSLGVSAPWCHRCQMNDKLTKLGGAEWVRECIDKAKITEGGNG